MDKVHLAAVATESFRGDEEYRNVAQAVAHVEEAAAAGARIVCFPEGYPGPCNGPMDSGGKLRERPLETLRKAARRHGVYIACGELEESEVIPDTYSLAYRLLSPEGAVLFTYRRCQPTPPAVNAHLYGGRHHLLPGNELVTAKTELGTIGTVICSEIKVPELARVEMLKGAEILLVPFGGTHGRQQVQRKDKDGVRLIDKGRMINRAVLLTRAVENCMFIVAATNIWEKESTWGACIASPDGILAETEGPGIAYAELDLARLRFIRTTSLSERDYGEVPTSGAEAYYDLGQLRDRRPDLYGPIVQPQPQAWDFFYHRKGLATWRETFDPVARPRSRPRERPAKERAAGKGA